MPDLDALLHKAHWLLQHKKPSEAEKQLIQIIRHDPQHAQAFSLLARCKYEQKKFAEGIDATKTAIALAADVDYYHYLLSFGYYQVNQHQQAIEQLNTAIRLNPYTADYFGLLSLILLEEKDFKKALNAANEGLAIDGESIACLNARSTALNKLQQTDDAMETMRNALDKDPENDFTHTTIGWNLLEKGKNKEAAVHFKEALRINPELEGARTGLKEALKSRIPPYKWLLQYSFWINNKGKNARWFIPIGIYLAVRIIFSASGNEEQGTGMFGGVVLGAYLLLAATSWIINPLANFFLLFNKDGKYALTANEKLNSILFISALGCAILLALAGWILSYRGVSPERWLAAALVAASLGLPLGHMSFPIRLSQNHKLQWYAIGLVGFGCISLALLLFAPLDAISGALIAYGIAFVLYTWLSALLPR